jgi:hypothetical protein
MRSRRSLIFWLTLCLLLGAVTTWLVAWGSAALHWYRRIPYVAFSETQSFAIEGQYLFNLSRSVFRLETRESWSVGRLDRNDDTGSWVGDKAERWKAIADAAREPSQKTPGSISSDPWDPVPDASIADEFQASYLSALPGESGWTVIGHNKNGWPWRSMARATLIVRSEHPDMDLWTLTLKGTQPSVPPGMSFQPPPLQLPLRPIFPGYLLNTGFYGVLWSVPFFGLPLLRARRRRRKGRCPRCSYDLKHAFDPGCPECGWGRSGGT